MSGLNKLFEALALRSSRAEKERREPGLSGDGGPANEPESLSDAVWREVRAHTQAEVRALASKCLVESIYGDRPGLAYEDREALLQAAANRLYADALYRILKAQGNPPVEPRERILLWVDEALDDSPTGWRLAAKGAQNGEAAPRREANGSIIDAIVAAVERASWNGVLMKAAEQRLAAEAIVLAAE